MSYLHKLNRPRHKVFVSYHHYNDQNYRNLFEHWFANIYDIMVSKSVQVDEINPYLNTETIRQKIRDEHLRDSMVTVVLIGPETWKRKHVDWEIGSSIRSTIYNPRLGLLGLFLPSHPDYGKSGHLYNQSIIPPRLHFNVKCGFADLYDWSTNAESVQRWIHYAFEKRNSINPDNSYPSFTKNRSGYGWH